MARSGISKFHVKQARDTLLAKGQNPSLDAIRLALGNTGSRTTIHRYLRELEAEDGTRLGDRSLLSDTLKDLVERLSAQLQAEALEVVEHQQQRHAQQVAGLQSRLEDANKQRDAFGAELDHYKDLLAAEQAAHQATAATYQLEQIRSHQLAQEVAGLKDQLAAAEKHQASLEEKHQHAREALEHYRQSIKELREQDQRRHEHQLQQTQAEQRQLQQSLVIKQSEITELSKDSARLAAELAETRKQIHREQQTTQQQLNQAKEKEQWLDERRVEATQQAERYRGELTTCSIKLAETISELHSAQQLNSVLQSRLEEARAAT